jgi:drug/metabolite transporter (DMT)-like permease
MIRNVRTRRLIASWLAVAGVALLLLAPQDIWLGIVVIALGLALELIGMNLRHKDS